MKSTRILHTLLAIFLATSPMLAQKYGHLNPSNLLIQMPEVKKANTDLEAYQKQLATSFEQVAKALEDKIRAYQAEVASGKLSQMDMQKREATLEKERQTVLKQEQEATAKIQKKRQELLQPILERVDKAVKAVANENGYQFIFDVSIPDAILFAKDSDDITPLVKAKLGL